MRRWMTRGAAAGAALAAAVVLGACSSPSQQASTATDVPPVPTVAASGARTPTPAPGSEGGAFGPGCAGLPLSDDPGSLANMSLQPVAGAVASNPELSTLSEAISRANLTAQLNVAPGLTLFAPTNEAFEKLPAGRLESLLANPAQLTALLENHVATPRENGAELRAAGTVTTVGGGTLRIAGEGVGAAATLTVAGTSGAPAAVECGDITTANATVFLIDSVLPAT